MSLTKRQLAEEKEAMELIETMDNNENMKKIEAALQRTKKHDTGFVLTSQFVSTKQRKSSSGKKRSGSAQLPMVIGSPIGTPPPSRKSSPSPTLYRRNRSAKRQQKTTQEEDIIPQTYLTEYLQKPLKVDMAVQSNEDDLIDIVMPKPPPASPEQRSEQGNPNEINDIENTSQEGENPEENLKLIKNGGRKPGSPFFETEAVLTEQIPVSEKQKTKTGKRDKKLKNRISAAQFARLNLSERPNQFTIRPRTPKIPKPAEPIPSNIYITRVPKEGGSIKSPFYAQVDIPKGALQSDVILKFETQNFNSAKLDLDGNDKLCSYVIDLNMNPMTFSLHKEATVRMRILEECINKHEDVVIVSARHFQWARVPTQIESKNVGGDLHYYATTKTQYLGKYAVITTQKLDRFVMTKSGGTFYSTIEPLITMKLEEKVVKKFPHVVEMAVANCKNDAVFRTSNEIQNLQGVDGQLVASSPFIEITKATMGRSGMLSDGITLPSSVRLTVPITSVAKKVPNEKDVTHSWHQPEIRILKRQPLWLEKPLGRQQEKLPGLWEDVTANQSVILNPIAVQNGEAVMFDATVPSQFLVLVFDKGAEKVSQGRSVAIDEFCEVLKEHNRFFDASVIMHQRISQPEIISVHLVPDHARTLICDAMSQEGDWRLVGNKQGILIQERQCVGLSFKGAIQLTINQIEPEIQFNSRRWQGCQFQLEATEEAYSDDQINYFEGWIDFKLQDDDSEKDELVLHTIHVSLPHNRAKPYKEVVIEKPKPKVTVFREYKLKWMKNLSNAEREKYKEINTP